MWENLWDAVVTTMWLSMAYGMGRSAGRREAGRLLVADQAKIMAYINSDKRNTRT